MDYNNNFVITIGRRMGSGGRMVAKALAERLGVNYYDRQLLVEAARDAGMALEFFEKRDECFPKWVSGMFSFAQGYLPLNAAPGTEVGLSRCYNAIETMIRTIAGRESCILVGRTADYVLRDHPRCINLFINAPAEACIARLIKRGAAPTEAAAKALADKTNRLRSEFYNFFTDKRWGDSSSYDLTFDSSKLPLDKIVELIVCYMRLRGIDV